MEIVEIAFTAYPVTDIQRARAFYEDVLKLESTRNFESGDRHWTGYDLGPSIFAISNMSSEDGNLRMMIRLLLLRSKISILPWPG
jgi:catechol 2,3-dioxygenase-like lactoylglutathione lyase family enzyme